MNSYLECLSPEQEFLEIIKDENSEYRERILRAGAYLDLLIVSLCSQENLDLDRVRICLDVMANELDCEPVLTDITIQRKLQEQSIKYWASIGKSFDEQSLIENSKI